MISGPLEYLEIGFEGNRLSGEIISELAALKQQGITRVVDLVLIRRDQQGNVTTQELSDLSPDEATALNAVSGDLRGLFTEEDIASLAADVPYNSAAAIVLLEFMWAAKLRDAIVRANGVVFSEGLVPMADVQSLEAELDVSRADVGTPAYGQ